MTIVLREMFETRPAPEKIPELKAARLRIEAATRMFMENFDVDGFPKTDKGHALMWKYGEYDGSGDMLRLDIYPRQLTDEETNSVSRLRWSDPQLYQRVAGTRQDS